MTRRPLYLGEGVRDVGAASDVRRRVPCAYEGDLPRLVRRMAELIGREIHFGYDASTFRDVIARTVTRDGRPMRAGGKSKELRDAVFYSLKDSNPTPSAIVALTDARDDEFEQLRKDAVDILAQCQELRADVPVVIGLALHEIEIWMLADPDARTAAFGPEIGAAPLPDARLEHLGDPKQLWATYAGRVSVPEGIAEDEHRDEMRSSAWRSLRPNVVSHSCPRGFAPFYADLQPALRAFLG